MPSFIVENVRRRGVEQAIDKRASMRRCNLNDYVKFQMARAGDGRSGVGSIGAEMAVGMAMASR